jgi:hypothetical protein
MNYCRAVGDSVVESAEFQFDWDLRTLHTWNLEWEGNCPQEICFELKRVHFQLVKIVVEREARQGCLFVVVFYANDFSLVTIFVIALF